MELYGKVSGRTGLPRELGEEPCFRGLGCVELSVCARVREGAHLLKAIVRIIHFPCVSLCVRFVIFLSYVR